MSDSSIRYDLPEVYRTFHFPDGELQIIPGKNEDEQIGILYGRDCKLLGKGIVIDEDFERWNYNTGISIADAAILLNLEIEGTTAFKIEIPQIGTIVINFFVEAKPYMFNIYFEKPNIEGMPKFDNDIITVLFKPRSFIEQMLKVRDFIDRKFKELVESRKTVVLFTDYKEIKAFQLQIQKYLVLNDFVIKYSDIRDEG